MREVYLHWFVRNRKWKLLEKDLRDLFDWHVGMLGWMPEVVQKDEMPSLTIVV